MISSACGMACDRMYELMVEYHDVVIAIRDEGRVRQGTQPCQILSVGCGVPPFAKRHALRLHGLQRGTRIEIHRAPRIARHETGGGGAAVGRLRKE
jgi:hypothetical protein